jgi:hypothetical protein
MTNQPSPILSDHSGYPLPSYASTIWLAGDHLCLAIASGPDSKPHVIRLPLAKCQVERTASGATAGTAMGWQALLEVLKQRQATQAKPVRLGDRAAPVQYDIDEMLGAMRNAPKAKRFGPSGQRELDYDDLFAEDQK